MIEPNERKERRNHQINEVGDQSQDGQVEEIHRRQFKQKETSRNRVAL